VNRTQITRDHKAERIDAVLTLADLVPLPAPTAANRAKSEEVIRRAEGGEGFFSAKPSEITKTMTAYRLSDGPARLRDLMTEDIALRSRQTRPRVRNFQREGGRVGSAYEYARYRRGATTDPRFWERRERVERRHVGEVTIHATAGMHANEDALALEWTGATAWALADLLEAIGYRVTIRVVFGVTGNSKEIDGAVTVKDADERLSETALAFLCHGGVARLLRFAWELSTSAVMRSDMGSPRSYDGALKADITVPHGVRSATGAEVFIRETMRRYTDSELDEEERRDADRDRALASRSALGL
jgi:hypothetical protein